MQLVTFKHKNFDRSKQQILQLLKLHFTFKKFKQQRAHRVYILLLRIMLFIKSEIIFKKSERLC